MAKTVGDRVPDGPLTFKYHGNYGGPNYTGKVFKGEDFSVPTTDLLDKSFRKHDYYYHKGLEKKGDREHVKDVLRDFDKYSWTEKIKGGLSALGFAAKSLVSTDKLVHNTLYGAKDLDRENPSIFKTISADLTNLNKTKNNNNNPAMSTVSKKSSKPNVGPFKNPQGYSNAIAKAAAAVASQVLKTKKVRKPRMSKQVDRSFPSGVYVSNNPQQGRLIERDEYVQDINGSATFVTTSFPFNPALATDRKSVV